MSDKLEVHRSIDRSISLPLAPAPLTALEVPTAEHASASFDPGIFDRVGSFVQQRNARELLSHLLIDGNLNILDLGCANGDFALSSLLPRCGETGTLTGIDLSKAMISEANTRLTSAQLARTEFLVGDLTRLEDLHFNPSFYHVAFSNFVLHWLNREQAIDFLGGLRPALADGAVALFRMPIEGTYDELVESARAVVESGAHRDLFDAQSRRRFSFPDADDFVALLKASEFEITDAHISEVWRPFSSRESLAEWFFHTMSPFTYGYDALNKAEKASLGREIVDYYVDVQMKNESDYPGRDSDIIYVRDVTLTTVATVFKE